MSSEAGASRRSLPGDLAAVVSNELSRRHLPAIEESLLRQVFETLFYVSLRTEEGQPITCHVVYLDPEDLWLQTQEQRPHQSWSFIPFASSIAFTESSLTKLAKATDPRSSSIAVYPDESGTLSILGLVDQGNSFLGYVNHERQRGFAPPGVFQASIEGTGRIAAYSMLRKIAELSGGDLLDRQAPVFERGPIQSFLMERIQEESVHLISERLQERYGEPVPFNPEFLYRFWISMLSRLLLRAKAYRHGGAVLLGTGIADDTLRLKYELFYPRLRMAIPKLAFQSIVDDISRKQMVRGEQVTATNESIYPKGATLTALATTAQLVETEQEIDDAIWFISTLTRVDGLVFLDSFLGLHGFGGEIRVDQDPPRLFLAGDAEGSVENRRELDPERYGMRHRSMLRWCWISPQGVGFVISQDGDVRAVMRVADGVMLWDNIKLQRAVPSHDFRVTTRGTVDIVTQEDIEKAGDTT